MIRKLLFPLLSAVVYTVALALTTAGGSQPQQETASDMTLVPFKAILLDQIEFNPWPLDFGRIRPKKGYKLLSVFFSGFHSDRKTEIQESRWTVHYRGRQANSIGLGMPGTEGRTYFYGSVGDNGSIIIRNATKDFLISLIFVVPASLTELELKSPSGLVRKLSIDKKWVPTEKNIPREYTSTNLRFDIKDENIEPRSPMKPIKIR